MPNQFALRRLAVTVTLIVACASGSKSGAGAATKVPSSEVPRLVLNTVVTDSQVFRRPSLGTLFRYGSGEEQRDVFVYSKSWPGPADQARIFIHATEIEKNRGQFTSYSIESSEPVSIHVLGSSISGHEVVLKLESKAGAKNSYFVVVDLPREYVKFRITRKAPLVESDTKAFVKAWVEAYLTGGAK